MAALSLPDPPLTDGVLTLRPRRRDDVDAVVAACQDPEIPRWTSVPANYLPEDYESWLERSEAADSQLDLFAVDADDNLIGSFALIEIDVDRSYAEIGYWLVRASRGKGYATRAVRLLHAWGRDELGLTTFEILVDPENLPSRRVALAAGFTEEGLKPAPARCGADHPDLVSYVSSVP